MHRPWNPNLNLIIKFTVSHPSQPKQVSCQYLPRNPNPTPVISWNIVGNNDDCRSEIRMENNISKFSFYENHLAASVARVKSALDVAFLTEQAEKYFLQNRLKMFLTEQAEKYFLQNRLKKISYRTGWKFFLTEQAEQYFVESFLTEQTEKYLLQNRNIFMKVQQLTICSHFHAFSNLFLKTTLSRPTWNDLFSNNDHGFGKMFIWR